ncbi:unnamed protein product [Symbiodinium microadriaticum]|nr:unnamed protein product [Symbiodinium microadriaticum]
MVPGFVLVVGQKLKMRGCAGLLRAITVTTVEARIPESYNPCILQARPPCKSRGASDPLASGCRTLMAFCRLVATYLSIAAAWNSAATLDNFYTFQEFYTDAQYGPDFGYYSTGRILHSEPATKEDASNLEYFNSYTTQPMSLSPFFGQLVAERLVSMWISMDRPTPFFVIEFGGGTGILARDILTHASKAHPDFYQALRRYVIGERSQALQQTQKRTCAKFVQDEKLRVDSSDARGASKMRQLLSDDAQGSPLYSVVLSNELLDEFDPVRLRLSWQAGNPPDVDRCKLCSTYREAHVLHRIEETALQAVLRSSQEAKSLADAIRWEGKSLPCGLLDTQLLQRQVLERLSSVLTSEELRRCSPMQVCCTALLLAVDALMQDDHSAIQLGKLAASDRLLHKYRQQLARTNGTILLSKARYRELRRLALEQGLEVEQEVYFALSPARLQGWRERHAKRLAAGAKIRAQVAHLYDRRWSRRGEGTLQLKILVQPGHAQFVQEASALVDEGFLVSMDYGADADALLWQALVHPNHEGIHIMDARQATSQCAGSYLECPGLQDITMTVDFTEAAEAGRKLAQWNTRAYGPIFHLELAYDPWPLGFITAEGGCDGPSPICSNGQEAWYRHSGVDAWASFKILVQQRGQRGRSWSLGAPELSWPLQEDPALASSPKSCWNNDMTKPTLASLIAQDARGLGVRAGTALPVEEAFRLRLSDAHKLQEALDQQHAWQRQAYRDLHLAQLLTDYYLHFARDNAAAGFRGCTDPDSVARAGWLDEVHLLASSRRLPEMHGPEMFNRVFAAVAEGSHGNFSDTAVEPFLCTVRSMIASFCRVAANSVPNLGG